MVEQVKKLEREYIIPLRRHWLNVPKYERTGKAVKAIKKFIARHMKVNERDTDKVKLDVYFNNELWFKGRANPPSKVKVKAIKEGDIVKVEFYETPDYVKFLKAKHERRHKPAEKKETKEEKEDKKKEEKTDEQKKEEQEKERAVATEHAKEAKIDALAKKHTTKPEKAKHPQRMALKK